MRTGATCPFFWEYQMSYAAPLKDMLFVVNELADLAAVHALPGCEDATPETVEAVLEENAKFCGEVVAPLNVAGDQEPSSWKDGEVTTTRASRKPSRRSAQAGWQGVQHPVEFGGQGLPKLVATPCIEMLNSRQPVVRAVPAADRRRHRGAADGRQRRAEEDLPGQPDLGQVDRHHEPDRAAGRLRPGAGAHPRGAAGRRHLQGVRHQDLHHLRRA